MKLNQLAYFIAVAEEGNISRAAARLNISQPPLTRQIQNLEVSLGVTLFNRHAGGMALTEAGVFFLQEARNAKALIELAAERVKRVGRGELGHLDIGVFGSAIIGRIPSIIHEFRSRHPDVDVSIHWMTKAEQLHALRHRVIDIAFNRMLEPQRDVWIECIAREEIFLAVNSSSHLAGLAELELRACSDESFILFPTAGRPGFYDKALEMCKEAGFVPKVAQEVGDIMTGVALVASGFGVALVTESITAIAIPNVEYKRLTTSAGAHTVDLSCMYLRNSSSPVLQNFLEITRLLTDQENLAG